MKMLQAYFCYPYNSLIFTFFHTISVVPHLLFTAIVSSTDTTTTCRAPTFLFEPSYTDEAYTKKSYTLEVLLATIGHGAHILATQIVQDKIRPTPSAQSKTLFGTTPLTTRVVFGA